MNTFKAALGVSRPNFLILTPACVLLGLATAMWTQGSVDWSLFALIMIGALCAHISVNSLNEYADFKSGLDEKTERTPFSGGTGILPANPEYASVALWTGLVALTITGAIGVYFLFLRGPELLPLGLLGVFVILAYTPWITRSPILCLIAAGLGFGPLMVMGTDFVLTGEYSWTAFFASLVPFFLVSDLLLLNQFPDVEADQTVGRRHFPVVVGRRNSSLIYGGFLALAFVSLGVGVWLGYLPVLSLIGLLALLLAVPAFLGAYRNAEDSRSLIPFMGMNVILNIATPILVAAGIYFS